LCGGVHKRTIQRNRAAKQGVMSSSRRWAPDFVRRVFVELSEALTEGVLGLSEQENTNRQAKVHKKQQLMTPSLRFPLQAGGTE
jgi:ABC-type arginine transport system ATPase subunit